MPEEIKKIVELGIDLEGVENDQLFEELGVDIISLVQSPAIEESFMYFNREEFVTPNADESHDDFIGRCMSALDTEFPDTDQRYAVCESYWDTKMTKCEHEEMSPEFERAVIDWATDNGEQASFDDVWVDLTKNEFSTVAEVLDGLRATDALQRMNIDPGAPAEVFYRYQGSPSPQRTFCKAMMRLSNAGRMFTRQQITRMDSLNPQFARRDESSYSIFRWKGGKNCNHYWQKLAVFKNNEGKRVIMVLDPSNRSERTASLTWGQMFSNTYNFEIVDDEKRLVYGPVMVPNKMILRRDEKGEPFYVYFSAKTIRKMAEKFLQQNKLHNTDVEHDGLVTVNNRLVESWISESSVYDKSYQMGWALQKGTWFVGYKINDEETWKDIKEGRLRGFSLTGNFLNRIK